MINQVPIGTVLAFPLFAHLHRVDRFIYQPDLAIDKPFKGEPEDQECNQENRHCAEQQRQEGIEMGEGVGENDRH